jgi:hypothetical protein
LHGDFNIGIALVISELDVEPGPVLLDQIRFQEEGFCL